MEDKLADLDRKMGPLFLFSVLIEEVGELSKAIRDNNEGEVKNELVDLIFVAFCLANVFDVEIEPLLKSKCVNRSFKEIIGEWDDVTWKVQVFI